MDTTPSFTLDSTKTPDQRETNLDHMPRKRILAPIGHPIPVNKTLVKEILAWDAANAAVAVAVDTAVRAMGTVKGPGEDPGGR